MDSYFVSLLVLIEVIAAVYLQILESAWRTIFDALGPFLSSGDVKFLIIHTV